MPTLSSYSFRSLPICLQHVVSPYCSITLLIWMTGFFEITAPTESLSAGHGRHQSNDHRGTEVKDSDLFRSYFFYSNGKSLHTGPSQYLGSKFLQLRSYFFYANLKYLALLGTRT